MSTCTKSGCNKDARSIVKLLLFVPGYAKPAEVFATICACCEEHRAPDGDIHLFFRNTWETLVTGFEQRGLPGPALELTQFAWVDIEEYEEFKKQYAGADPKSTKVVHIN